MEIFNSKGWLGLSLVLGTMMCLAIYSCSANDEPVENGSIIRNGEVISLSNGELIMLEDTVTYTVEPEDLLNETIFINYSDDMDDLFNSASRSVNSLRAYGYDDQVPETGWKKFALGSSWQKYGVTPGYYICRYVAVHKDLSIESGTYARPLNYASPNVPQNVEMGWNGTTGTIGFTTLPKSEHLADGVTRIFIINCDLSGIVYDKKIPADPTNFTWAYVLETEEDLWD